jgi:hypothetical protein
MSPTLEDSENARGSETNNNGMSRTKIFIKKFFKI